MVLQLVYKGCIQGLVSWCSRCWWLPPEHLPPSPSPSLLSNFKSRFSPQNILFFPPERGLVISILSPSCTNITTRVVLL
jgi:hypothetical protein